MYSNCTQSKIPFYPIQNSFGIFNTQWEFEYPIKMKNVCGTQWVKKLATVLLWAQYCPCSAVELGGFWFHVQTGSSNFTFTCRGLSWAFGRALIIKMSPQCRAYTRALRGENSKSPIFHHTDDWCITWAHYFSGERGGSVVECPTAAVLCPWARHFTPRKYWLITQEAVAPSRHDWEIVDWDVKPQHKQNIFSHDQLNLFQINIVHLRGSLNLFGSTSVARCRKKNW